MIEKLGRGELAIITSDGFPSDATPTPINTSAFATLPTVPQHVHYHAGSTAPGQLTSQLTEEEPKKLGLPKLVATGLCAAIIVGSLLYVADRLITITSHVFSPKVNTEDITTPATGDVVAGYEVSDEYGIRPVHPVTGALNVPHNGVDLAMPVGTPIYAVGKEGDTVEIKCWWDIDGGGWVVNQTADSYPNHVFQSLHMSETGCINGFGKAGDKIAYSGNSGLGTGAHYDFRVKIDGEYVPPATNYLESAVTGKPPQE
ncbi:MAG: M23 family metallopeptidase [Cyanobacteria bacterium J06629_19]